MTYKFNISSLFYFFFSSILIIGSLISFLINNETNIISVCAFLICILFSLKYLNNRILFLFFIFLSSYCWPVLVFFYKSIPISAWQDFQNKRYVNMTILFHSIFVYTFGNIIKRNLNLNIINQNVYIKNTLVFYINVIVSILILLYGSSGDNIFIANTYGAVQKSTLNEYFIIFYFLMLISFRSNIQRFITYLIGIMYFAKNILMGGRIEVIQLSLLVFFLSSTYYKLRNINFYIILISLFYFNSLFGHFRNDPIGFLNGENLQYLNPFYISANDYQSSNQGDVIQSSCRIIGIELAGEISYFQKFISLVSLFFSSITPNFILPHYTQLASYLQDRYSSGGGALISAYFFVWLGYFGPFLVAIFLGLLLNISNKTNNIYLKVYTFLVFIMFPRWIAYSPLALFKFCVYGSLLFLLFHKYLKSKHST